MLFTAPGGDIFASACDPTVESTRVVHGQSGAYVVEDDTGIA